MSFAISCTWKPNIFGRYLSALSETLAVLATSPTPSTAPSRSSRIRLERRNNGSSALRRLFAAGSLGPYFGGIMVGYTRKNKCGNDVPKYAPSIDPCRDDFGE